MNSIKTLILTVIVILGSFVANASIIPASLPMIGRTDTIRNYALGSVTHGSRGISSPGMDWSYSEAFTHTNAVGVGAEAVLGKLFGSNFQFRLLNPNDKVTGNVWLYDDANNLVFYGNVEYPQADNGKVTPQYNIWMQQVTLLSDVQSAEILVLNQDGVTANRSQVTVVNGHILFDWWKAGAPNGLLSVRFKDGTLATYRLDNPVNNTPGITTIGTSDAWKIEGHYVYAPAGGPAKVVKIIEPWLRPTVYVEVAAGEVVTFDVLGLVQTGGGTRFERPTSFTFKQTDGPWSGAGVLDFTKGLPQISFPTAGAFRLEFDWVDFGKPQTLYSGPVDGGKG